MKVYWSTSLYHNFKNAYAVTTAAQYAVDNCSAFSSEEKVAVSEPSRMSVSYGFPARF
jgi:hypothetical protein